MKRMKLATIAVLTLAILASTLSIAGAIHGFPRTTLLAAVQSPPPAPKPAAGPPRTITTLPNGLTVAVEENSGAPVVAVQIWVNVGSGDETDAESGISHLIEHMLFKGSKKRGVGVMANEVESLGGDFNGWTDNDNTVFLITISSRYFDNALDILSDMVSNPLFDAQELDREREVVLEEVRRGEDNPQRRLYNALVAEAYQVHPYTRPVIGYEKTVKSFTRDDLARYHRKWYVPGNMTVVVAGNVKPAQVFAAAKRCLGNLKPGELPRPKLGARPILEPPQTAARVKAAREDVAEGYMLLGYHATDIAAADTPALDVLSIILGGGESSRLVYRVRTERRLVDDIGTYSDTPRDAGLFLVSAAMSSEQAVPALNMILQQLYLLKHEPIEDWELEKARQAVAVSQFYTRETVDGQVTQLGVNLALAGDLNFDQTYLQKLAAVTKEDIRRVAQKYLLNQNLSIALILPPSSESQTFGDDATLKKVILESVLPGVQKWDQNYAGGSLPEPNPITPPEVPVKETTPGTAGVAAPVRYVLANGVRLIVRENHTVPLVSVYAGFQGGLRRETPANNGVNNFIAETITEGTAKYTAAQVHSLIEARAGGIGGYSGRNAIGITMSVPSMFLRSSLDLFGEVLRHPAFPAAEVERVRQSILADLKTQKDQPLRVAFRLFRSELYRQHPYGMDVLGTEETVKKLTREDLLAYYRDLAAPGNLVISVVGDVNALEVKKAFEDMFKDWAAAPSSPPPIPLEPPPDNPRESVQCRAKVQQTNMVIGFQGASLAGDDRYALEVLQSVLSGMSGRLFMHLRSQQSLAYGVSAFMDVGLDPGFFGVYIGTAPDKETVARAALMNELKIATQTTITKAELKRAQQVNIGGFEIGLQAYSSQALMNLQDELFGLGFRSSERYAEKVAAVTQKKVLEVAKKYIKLDAPVAGIVRPCSQ